MLPGDAVRVLWPSSEPASTDDQAPRLLEPAGRLPRSGVRPTVELEIHARYLRSQCVKRFQMAGTPTTFERNLRMPSSSVALRPPILVDDPDDDQHESR